MAANFSSLQIDYFERAKRLEEIPLIKKAYEEQRIKDMELWELQEEERVCWSRVQVSKIKRCVEILFIYIVTIGFFFFFFVDQQHEGRT